MHRFPIAGRRERNLMLKSVRKQMKYVVSSFAAVVFMSTS